ncbi:hypothetical protein H257_12858 [Aphanomyces astaci]|uniref:Uncharacterized protein n=1 Tax=Aphanomyces astaci TaxID=112090 RepID=W4FYL3_APHAT|nr:hypothetical protein H257_12858 [Aphanomyces astaci]ETV72066.1 hypothetical protein H257_12858 [Aphanomyces astaci]|eukprot:XP_009838509.1 hypothetical protein H257_12858 [Aphanomyces astaci]
MFVLLPTTQDDNLIRRHLLALKKFKSITLALQRRDVTLSEARLVFDRIRQKYTCLDSHLAPDSNIVRDEGFESAITKVQRHRESTLSALEKKSLKRLQRESVESIESDSDGSDDFAMVTLKRQRTMTSAPSGYVCTKFNIKRGGTGKQHVQTTLHPNAIGASWRLQVSTLTHLSAF